MDGDTANVWQEIEIRVDTDPFCTSCQISTINKNPISKTPLNPKTPIKWVFMDIIPYIYTKILTKDTTLYNYLLILDAYSILPKIYGMEKITNEDGQARYVSSKIWKMRGIWLVGFGDNPN